MEMQCSTHVYFFSPYNPSWNLICILNFTLSTSFIIYYSLHIQCGGTINFLCLSEWFCHNINMCNRSSSFRHNTLLWSLFINSISKGFKLWIKNKNREQSSNLSVQLTRRMSTKQTIKHYLKPKTTLKKYTAKECTLIEYTESNNGFSCSPVSCWSNEIQATVDSIIWKWCSVNFRLSI